jgi:hypothetical protein
LYLAPTVPAGSVLPEEGEIAKGIIAAIVIEGDTLTDLGGVPESVAVKTAVETETAVGIPEMLPDENVSPPGSVPDLSFQVMLPTPPWM